jgi:hypothetical protein
MVVNCNAARVLRYCETLKCCCHGAKTGNSSFQLTGTLTYHRKSWIRLIRFATSMLLGGARWSHKIACLFTYADA